MDGLNHWAKEKARTKMAPVECGPIILQIEEAESTAARWALSRDPAQLAGAHASFLELSQSTAPGVGRYGECSLGGLYSRNSSYMAAYRYLDSCVTAGPSPPGLALEARGGCLGELWRENDGASSKDVWAAARWEASFAGQLGRLLMRFSQAQAALDALAKADAFLAPAVAAEAREAPRSRGNSGSGSHNEGPATLAAAAVAGFTGLVKRTQKNHAAALPLLRQGLALAATARDSDYEEGGDVAQSSDGNTAAAACASQDQNCAAREDADGQNAKESKNWRQKLWDRKSAGKSGGSSSSNGGGGDAETSSTGNSSSEVQWMHRGLAGAVIDRWWDRADVREMFINYGDACLRAMPPSAPQEEEQYRHHHHQQQQQAPSMLPRTELEAKAAYVMGTAAGLFAHPMQRPVHEVRHPLTGESLEARAVWATNAASSALKVSPSPLLSAQSGLNEDKNHRKTHENEIKDDDEDEFAYESRRSSSLGSVVKEMNDDGSGLKEASKKVAVYLHALEAHWEALRDEAQSLLRDSTAGAATTRGGGEARGLPALKSSTSSSSKSSSFTARCTMALQRWLFPSQGPSHAGFAPANDMLLHADSGFLSSVWWGAKFDFGLPAVWAQFFVYEHGLRDHNNCARAPVACHLAAQLGSGGLVLGDAKYSLLAPGAQVRPHCGPSNGRLRLHVGLDVHPEDVDKMGLKVGGHTLRWVNGQTLAFDDSFEHGVWHNGSHPRLIFILDVWHPDLLQEDLSYGSTTADGASSNGGTTFLEEQPPPPPLWHSDPSFHGLNPDTAMGTTDGAEVSSTETLATNPSPPAALPELWAPRKFAPQGFSAREAMPALGAPVTVLKNNPQAYGKLWPRAGLGPVPSSSSWSAADSSSSSSALFAFFGGSSGSMFPSAATTMNGNWADVLVPCALTSGIAIVLWAYWKWFLQPQVNKLRAAFVRRAERQKAHQDAGEGGGPKMGAASINRLPLPGGEERSRVDSVAALKAALVEKALRDNNKKAK